MVRLMAPRLDGRIAAGEDLLSDAALACRAGQLVSKRARGRVADGLERVLPERLDRRVSSAAMPVDRDAVVIARPALEQLARALRSRAVVQPRGVALAHILLGNPSSALYQPAYREELYVLAREALFALGPDQAAVRTEIATRPAARS
jgi:hypothetical protein